MTRTLLENCRETRSRQTYVSRRLLEQCLVYPHNLGEGKLYGAQENDFHYLLGLCYRSLGDKAHSLRYLKEAEAMDVNQMGILAFNTLRETIL